MPWSTQFIEILTLNIQLNKNSIGNEDFNKNL